MALTKIQSFTQLSTWQEGHKLVLAIYKATEVFPDKEKYVLVSQMRRCVLSITSNIAEGFSRQGKKEKIQFYYMARGSITELQNQLLVSRDIKYLPRGEFVSLAAQTFKYTSYSMD